MLTFEPFRIYCVKNKLERKDVVARTNLSVPTVGAIFNDKFPIKSDTIERICKTYGLPIEQVIMYKEDEDGR